MGVLIVGCSGGGSKDKSTSAGDLFNAINEYRVANGLSELAWSDAVAAVAQNYAETLAAAYPDGGSYTPNYGGTTPSSRLSGLYNSWCGEAGKYLDAGYSAQQVLDNLDNKSVLLDNRAVSIGVGRAP